MGGRGSAGHSSAATASASPSAHQTPDGQDVLAAYELLARRPGDWMKITDVRNKLRELMPSATDAELDAALRRAANASNADVMPESNPKALTAADRRNAIRLGGDWNHLIAFGKHHS